MYRSSSILFLLKRAKMLTVPDVLKERCVQVTPLHMAAGRQACASSLSSFWRLLSPSASFKTRCVRKSRTRVTHGSLWTSASRPGVTAARKEDFRVPKGDAFQEVNLVFSHTSTNSKWKRRISAAFCCYGNTTGTQTHPSSVLTAAS